MARKARTWPAWSAGSRSGSRPQRIIFAAWARRPRWVREARTIWRTYARQLFGEPFDNESVIGESLQTPEEFLKGCLVTRFQTPGTGDIATMDPLAYESADEYSKAQVALWMGTIHANWTPEGACRRAEAACILSQPADDSRQSCGGLPDLVAELKKQLPGFGAQEDGYIDRLLGSFLALVSQARLKVQRAYSRWFRFACNSGCASCGVWWRRSGGVRH